MRSDLFHSNALLRSFEEDTNEINRMRFGWDTCRCNRMNAGPVHFSLIRKKRAGQGQGEYPTHLRTSNVCAYVLF